MSLNATNRVTCFHSYTFSNAIIHPAMNIVSTQSCLFTHLLSFFSLSVSSRLSFTHTHTNHFSRSSPTAPSLFLGNLLHNPPSSPSLAGARCEAACFLPFNLQTESRTFILNRKPICIERLFIGAQHYASVNGQTH